MMVWLCVYVHVCVSECLFVTSKGSKTQNPNQSSYGCAFLWEGHEHALTRLWAWAHLGSLGMPLRCRPLGLSILELGDVSLF